MNQKVIILIAQLKDDVLRGKKLDKAELLNLLTPFSPEELKLISETFLTVKISAKCKSSIPFVWVKSRMIRKNCFLILNVIKKLVKSTKMKNMDTKQLEKKLDSHVWQGEEFDPEQIKAFLCGICVEERQMLKSFVNIQNDPAHDYTSHLTTQKRGKNTIARCCQLETVFSDI